MISAYLGACLLALLLVIGYSSSAAANNLQAGLQFITTTGTGPDKWGSIWLITRRLNPESIEIVRSPPNDLKEAISFDYPGSRFNRTGESSTYSALVDHFSLNTDEVRALESMITEIEFEPWNTEKSVASSVMEIGFRNMQLKFGRTRVSRACYLEFFDLLMVKWKLKELTLKFDPNDLIPDRDCTDHQSVQPENIQIKVPEITQEALLKKLAANQKILFIDTREDTEFEEGHIPGSVNLKLREVSERTALGLPSADLVVAYCVKDFRGYETARKLRRHGLNAVIMKPYGIKGWIDAGLPIAGPKGTTKVKAFQQLEQRLNAYR